MNGSRLSERTVSSTLSRYLRDKGLQSLGKRSPFSHVDDVNERTFQIDLAIGPECTLGSRDTQQVEIDRRLFESHSEHIDAIVSGLLEFSLFPGNQASIRGRNREANPNPVYGIAIEVENSMSKYFLGSLLAASIAGRWGMLIIPDRGESSRWIETIHRMLHKGAQSPIPSNIAIFSWPTLHQHIVSSSSRNASNAG
jgi:hypothetical protein